MFSKDLYLSTPTSKALYKKYAKGLPIIDYHCHLSPKEMAENRPFNNIGELWLAHDHYKWRAMRAFGIDEELITGGAGWREKFYAFAKIMPYLVGNPLYIWCALELKRYFGIGEPLGESNAGEIYDMTAALIAERAMSPSYFVRQSNVEYIATTDDPADSLSYHKQIADSGAYGGCRIVPAFRPDKAFGIEKPGFAAYVGVLGMAAGVSIKNFGDMIKALETRLVAFKEAGSRLNDNGLTGFIWKNYTDGQIDSIFNKAFGSESASQAFASGSANHSFASGSTNRALNSKSANQTAALTTAEINTYRSAFLFETAKLYAKHGFTAQYHIGAYRNANSAMFGKLGPDTGYDSIGEPERVGAFGTLLDRLNSIGALPRTIFYPIDISQFEAFAALSSNFCGNGRGWVQLGAPWWFNDQYYGIMKFFDRVGNLYPVALSAGMLTDSRSFLSYPRHELYRRALCGYLGEIVDRGEYFSGDEALGSIIKDICYNNAKNYFMPD